MKLISTLGCLLAAIQLNAQPCIPNTNSIQFDGSTSYVSISPQTGLELSAAITIEAWIQAASFGFNSAQNSIVCKHGWSAGEGGYVLRCGGSGELSFNIAGIDTNHVNVSWVEVFSTINVLTLNTWYHVAGTFDGTELKCYVNGILVGNTPFAGSIAPSAAYPLALGRLADPVWGPDRYFSGSMDEVRVWNRALSQAEIQAGMNNHIDPTSVSGLVSYWRMNEGTASTVYDAAGTNNGGTVFCSWDTYVPFNSVPPVPVITYNGGVLYSSAPIGNQWYEGGSAIGGATQNSFTPQQNGVYTVEVTSAEGCSTLSAQFIVTDVGLIDLSRAGASLIIPNPFHDVAFITISALPDVDNVSLLVTDVEGRETAVESGIRRAPGVTTISIDRKNLCNGIYFYVVRTPGGIAAQGKMMIN